VHPCGMVFNKNNVLTCWLTTPDSRCWKQGVQLLSKPVEVNPSSSVVRVEADLDPQTGELTFKPTLF
jgi:type III protein arginine methyltransferase